ncbi:hypothetical protein TrLO_g7777 [Triparma laevis f. longispina]|uniref:Uncharacterized protein n=1 Tax=Triparma laevis f. longispina TaxID=1714387 RepID=A0A9W7FFP6_9STRA|nr:hypothetical protein TrLO_g7777 [Triparma laevis f. longispina]
MVYLNADGTVTSTKPFTVTGAITSTFSFFLEIFTLFFDSIFSTKDQLKAKRGNRGGGSSTGGNYSQRNVGYNRGEAVRRRGANVKTVGDMKAADAACGGGG